MSLDPNTSDYLPPPASSNSVPMGVAYAPPPAYGANPVAAMGGTMRVLGICYIVLGCLGGLIALAAAFFFPILLAGGTPSSSGLGQNAFPAGFGIFVALLIGLVAGVLPLCTGYGLLNLKSWARGLAIVNSFLILLSFPVGTALGGFTLYYLLRSGAREGYDQLSRTIV